MTGVSGTRAARRPATAGVPPATPAAPQPTEAELRRHLAHLEAIVDTSLNAVVGMNEQGEITTWSRQAEHTFGWRRAEVLGRKVVDTIVPPDLREAHRRGLRRYLETRQPRVLGTVVTVNAQHRSGHIFPAELAISPPLVLEGDQVEFIAFVRDVSDRSRAERMRAMQFLVTSTLAASHTLEEAGETILEAIATALQWPLGLLWRVDESRSRLHQISAWHSPDHDLGTVIRGSSTFAFAPGEGLPGRVWAEGRPITVGEFGLEPGFPRGPLVLAAGLHAAAAFPIHCRGELVGVIELLGQQAAPLDDVSLAVMADVGQQLGQFLERVAVNHDLAAALAELRAKAADLERSNTDLEQFARVASHDLQEPLRMVSSYLQLLDRRYRGQLGDDADEYIGFAVDGSQRMQALITDLLAYSRCGHRPEATTWVDAGSCLAAARTNLVTSIQESGAEITQGRLPKVRANPTQLTQVFQNLLGNAIKFRGEASPRIEVSARREGGDWKFTVRDNGIGVDPDQSERVFQLFQRLHARERYPGTGIGLSLCRRIIESLGGRIWLESEAGQGAAFHFTLRANSEPRAASEAPAAAASAAG